MPNTNANPSIEQLENTISAYINSVYKDVPPTEEEFKEKADLIRVSTTAIMPVNDQEYDEILKRLKQTLVIQMDIGTYINDRCLSLPRGCAAPRWWAGRQCRWKGPHRCFWPLLPCSGRCRQWPRLQQPVPAG